MTYCITDLFWVLDAVSIFLGIQLFFFKCRTHPEVPDRIQRPYDKHKEYGLLERCQELPVSQVQHNNDIDNDNDNGNNLRRATVNEKINVYVAGQFVP